MFARNVRSEPCLSRKLLRYASPQSKERRERVAKQEKTSVEKCSEHGDTGK
jgi:hypothetical protein